MDAKPAPLDERFLDVRGVRMRYFTGGDGPPLVLVHGLAGAAANWIDLGALLVRRHRLIVPELPGHSGSAPLPAAPNLDAYADRVRLVAEHEGALPAAFVGHSFGGLVSLRLALRHPEAVSSLVLAGSAGISSTRRWAEFWIAISGFARPAKLAAPFRDALGRHPALRVPIFGRWQTSDTRSLSPRMVEGFLAAAPLHSDVVSAGRALVRDDPRIDLEGVRCPCLVVWGARDFQVPIGDAFEYARRLRAPLRTIADCGHLLIGERPEAVAHAIEQFVGDKVPSRATPLESAVS
jgi:pimeloyl-ACP methyl ester carboxylesterase